MHTVQIFFRGEWRDLRSYPDPETARAALAVVRGLRPDLGFRIDAAVPPRRRPAGRKPWRPGVVPLGAAVVAVAAGSWWLAGAVAPRPSAPPSAPPALAPGAQADLRFVLDCAWLSVGIRGDGAKDRPFLEIARAIAPEAGEPNEAAIRDIRARVLRHGPEWVIAQARKCKDALPELGGRYR